MPTRAVRSETDYVAEQEKRISIDPAGRRMRQQPGVYANRWRKFKLAYGYDTPEIPHHLHANA